LARGPIHCQFSDAKQGDEHPEPLQFDHRSPNAKYKNPDAEYVKADSKEQNQILDGAFSGERKLIQILQRVRQWIDAKTDYGSDIAFSLDRDICEQPFTWEFIFSAMSVLR